MALICAIVIPTHGMCTRIIQTVMEFYNGSQLAANMGSHSYLLTAFRPISNYKTLNNINTIAIT